MNDGLLGFLRKYGQAGLDKLEELKAQGQGYASQVDEYFGINPKPDPRSIPPRPIVSRGPFESPDPRVPRPDPNAPSMLHNYLKPASEEPLYGATAGAINQVGKLMSKPLTERWETATKKANPMGILNTRDPLPREENIAAIRAASPGPQGLVATGGFPPKGMGMQSGRSSTQTPLGGIPLDASQYRPQQPQQPQITNEFPPSPMPLGAGVSGTGGVIDAHRQQQQQMQQQEKIKQQEMDKNGRFGISGYFDKLFNDPSRMAMLQGGLTMLDPRSYEDREGFSSPWTGLRAGMGAAGKGYQDIKKQQIEERKSESEIGLAGAKALKAINESEEAGTLNIAKHGTVAKTPEGTFYIDGYNRARAIARGVSLEDATRQNSFQIGSSRFKEEMKKSQAQSDASIKMIEQVLGEKGDPNKPGMIDWNTVGMPGAISGVAESIGSFFSTGVPMEATQLELAAGWIKAMTWRDLVGSGQISKYDYETLDGMLGVRGFLDSPDKVRIKYQKAMDFIKSKRQKPGTYLMGNQKISGIAAPDLSVLGSVGNTFSPVGGLSSSEDAELDQY